MRTIALVGNPNTGKTTLFNSILHANEHVGNWHGVTVEYREKVYKKNGESIATITDLPGIYSLSSFSFEEEVTRDYLLSHKDAMILNVVDGNCLSKNLLLTLELLECGFKPVLCINMANEIKKKDINIDVPKLEKMLGIKVFLINAHNKKEVKSLFDFIMQLDTTYQKHINISYIKKLTNLFDNLYQNCYKQTSFETLKQISDFQKIKLLELDYYFCDKISIKKDELQKTDKENFHKLFAELKKNDTLSQVFKARFDYINLLCTSEHKQIYGYSNIDKIVLNRFLCVPIFLIIVAAIFLLTFGSVGTFLTDRLSSFFQNVLFMPLGKMLSNVATNEFVRKFFEEALCGSIGTIFSFLPQIILMYLGLYILEDSGYMARIAFVFEDYMKRAGLTGKSIFTLLMCFGCSTTATLSSRNQNDKNSKIKTAMLTPYISCSAKLPLYAVVCGAFFPTHRFLVIIGFYLLGIVVALSVSYFLNKKVLKSADANFILEMPAYRFPSAKKVLKNVLINTKDFLFRAGGVLLCFSCIIWLLENINFKMQYGSGQSILDSISQWLAPILSPLGFGTSGVVTALLFGVIAKEIIVSTIGIVNNLGENSAVQNISKSIVLASSVFCLTPASSLSFLVFSTLYFPCVSTISVMSKEIGKKWTFLACLLQFAVAYILSFATYRISTYFIFAGTLQGVLSLLCFLSICAIIVLCVRFSKGKKKCKFCPKRKVCSK